MNDTYVEFLVPHKKNPLLPFVKFVLYGAAIACALWAFLGWIIMFAVAIVIACVAYFVIPMFDIEYEYLYLEKELSIDKVIAKERRKHVYTIDLNKVEKIAPEGSHELDSYQSREHISKDFSSGMPDAKNVIVVYEEHGQPALIKIQSNDELLKAIKTVFPRKVLEY